MTVSDSLTLHAHPPPPDFDHTPPETSQDDRGDMKAFLAAASRFRLILFNASHPAKVSVTVAVHPGMGHYTLP